MVELSVVEQRYQAVLEVLGGMSVTDVARRYGVVRQTVHGWLRRDAFQGLAGLMDRSSKPDSCPRQTPSVIETRIVDSLLTARFRLRRLRGRRRALIGCPRPGTYVPQHVDIMPVMDREYAELAAAFAEKGFDRTVVCIQGLGFSGAAMAAAVASRRREDGSPTFNVIGVELPTPSGQANVEAVNAGRVPMTSADKSLQAAVADAHRVGNLAATTDESVYELADVTLVEINIDISTDAEGQPHTDLDPFRQAMRTLGRHMSEDSLIIVASTVPPGTCASVAAPELAKSLRERGINEDAILLAHSYERVMPGPDYLDSIINYWRVYAGHTQRAAQACERFLSKVIDVERFPLTRLESTTASETAKILENSYRAVTIALMEEWGRFAEAVGIDMFQIVQAIRQRPTHADMRQPGFGVGGYCLTKDALFGVIAARELFDRPDLEFSFSAEALAINAAMPLVTLDHLQELLGGDLKGKRILLFGVSYRSEVADTRNSPSETFVREALERGAVVTCADPFVDHWKELDVPVWKVPPSPGDFDAVVFAVAHEEYRRLDVLEWIGSARPIVFDANDVLSTATRDALSAARVAVGAIGRGDLT